ncbi:proton-activated chloride channel [Paramormyrops kingsleyae]|uniref:Proton-activated chloride channel n=1 Tax=Paramormyrops kingsleyae TaxID=1676925 RepID=A0A3B3Q7W4_9TELE|nr:transmembrane protein 206 [Paramormyrops kingsleyae]
MTRENCRTYQKFSDDAQQCPSVCQENGKDDQITDDANDSELPGVEDDTGSISIGFNKACLKNVFTVLLILIYVLLTAVALFLAYQTISDFREKLSHPVMSVTFKEVDEYDAVGIALYLGKATLLSCQHHLHDHIPALVSPGNPGEGGCVIESVSYMDPYSNQTREVTVVQGPTDIRNRELIFLQFSQNETEEDFSSITYMLFYKFADLTASSDKAEFMKECERSYSMWTFSGGFRTWVKMSLIRTSGRGKESVEFRQESSVVRYNDKRPESQRTNQLFFVVFEWRDVFIQEVRDIVTANAWNSVAILCGVFMALFKVANFAKLSVKWIMKIRKAHLRRRAKEMTQVT